MATFDPRTPDAPPSHSRFGRCPPAAVLVSGVLVVALGAVTSAIAADPDGVRDAASLASRVAFDLVNLRVQFLALVLLLAGLHYLATAVAARAAVGLPLALRETILVQLAASAANRLTPARLGGSAVNARYFYRRGAAKHVAIGSVAALSVIGALADLAVLALVVFAGKALGLSGGAREIGLLASKLSGLAAPVRSPWLWSAIAAAVLGFALLRLSRRAKPTDGRPRLFRPALELARHPRRLGILLVASGSTTLILAFAFVASTAMVPGTSPHASVGALIVAFMASAAAGNAVPLPAGVGSTEIAFVGVLIAAAVPYAHAVEVVVVFRLITFWIPALVGVLATRRLRRMGAI